MKLTASNIAWPAGEEQEALRTLRRFGVGAVEVAPTRIWPEWRGATLRSARVYRRQLESEGFGIASLQAILFQKPELRLFGSDHDTEGLLNHLCFCADLAAELGATSVVFGAPKNRDRGELSPDEALVRAGEFFSRLAPYYAARSARIVFEANPSDYGCNFVTDSATAGLLVRAVGSDGFGLHLDSACMHLASEHPASAIPPLADILGHFHASEPHLAGFENPAADHAGIAAALVRVGYKGYVALEMRAGDPAITALEQALAYVAVTYASSN